MTSKITNTHSNHEPAGVPPAPSEAHQRAAGGIVGISCTDVGLVQSPRTSFQIRTTGLANGARPVAGEPIVGKWYCAMHSAYDQKHHVAFERGEQFGKYEGEGFFTDEEGEQIDMRDCDFLQEQY